MVEKLCLKQITPTPPYVVKDPIKFIQDIMRYSKNKNVKAAWKRCEKLKESNKK